MSPAPWRVLVVAKAPVAGLVKTRLGATVGMNLAAEVAAAALLDTLAAARAAVGPGRCHLALAGDLTDAEAGEPIAQALAGWRVRPQGTGDLAARLARAHADLAGGGPVVQVGSDTPQVTPASLAEVAAGLRADDAVLAPAADGGWWALGLRDPAEGAALVGVPMSTPQTYAATRAALLARGLSVATGRTLRDVDDEADAQVVAASAPGTRFARTWREAATSDRVRAS